MRCLVFLLAGLALCWAQTCNNGQEGRINCGYVGITESQCEAKGCCWNAVNPNPNNVPWCFDSSSPNNASCVTTSARVDCGYVGITASECESKGCCWSPVNPNPGNLPWCFYQNELVTGYEVSSFSPTDMGFIATLTLVQGLKAYGPDITPLTMLVSMETDTRLHVKIMDPSTARYEVPQEIWPRPIVNSKASNPAYKFSYTKSPFGFAVTRIADGMVLFNTSIPEDGSFDGLIFKDQFLSISSSLPAGRNMYGLAESTMPTGIRFPDTYTYTLWNRDIPAMVTNQNLYGSHPFYLQLLENGNAHGVFLLSSNGMDVAVQPTSITYKVIGGILDFYFFTGPTPDSVVQQYTQLIGLPHLPAYWALGFHQSKYGYPNIDYVEEVVANYSAANIPLDTIWNDIDYMNAYEDFTFSPTNYPNATVAAFVDRLHSQGQQYVVIVDPGIHYHDGYFAFDDIMEAGSYIRNASGEPFIGNVWPGFTLFPDFLDTNYIQEYWQEQIVNFRKVVPVDGLWLDMNEISNFCTGQCTHVGPPMAMQLVDDSSSSSSFNPQTPPYAINNGGNNSPLNTKTLDMTATHNGSMYLEYDVHNLYGFTECMTTKNALEESMGTRSFILSRSTFPGSGKYTAHWTGDNASLWPDLYYSIVGMLNFNMLGVPFVGSDICGFLDNTTPELCSRWIEVGAFYPFSRNHDDIASIPQELYRWPEVAASGRSALNARYSLLPYYYTLMAYAHLNGSSVARPLFFNFPTDANTWGIDQQFMIGSALMVTPVLTEGATSVVGYFPAGIWYNFFNYTMVKSNGENFTLDAPLEVVNVHIYQGSIVPQQFPALTTAASRLNNFYLLAALTPQGTASGSIYLDDGMTLPTDPQYAFTAMSFTIANNALSGSYSSVGYTPAGALEQITILGVTSAPSSVYVNGGKFSSFTYDSSTLALVLTNLPLTFLADFGMSWN